MKSTAATPPRQGKRAEIEISNVGDAAIARVNGLLDEQFAGFGDLGGARTLVVELSAVKFITSFGVRQWLRAMAALPPSVQDIYLAGCPRIFVEQLNMILNFGGKAQLLTLLAPYRCSQCNHELDQLVDIVAQGAELARGNVPEIGCPKCNGRMILDEIPEMYFACIERYPPRHVVPAAMQILATDTRALPKQVIRPVAAPRPARAAAAALPTAPRSSIVPWIVIGVMLAALATVLYILVGPS